MKYRQLGSTGLFVSEICLGSMTFGGEPGAEAFRGMGHIDQHQVDVVVGRALAAGVNFVDTADTYFMGQSERMSGSGCSKTTACCAQMSWLRPRPLGLWAEGPTIAALPADISWTRSNAVWSGFRSSTSISTKSTRLT